MKTNKLLGFKASETKNKMYDAIKFETNYRTKTCNQL